MLSVVNSRPARFLVAGGAAAALNLLLIGLFVERLGWNSMVLRNVANALAMELSLVFSFFAYRRFVWPGPRLGAGRLARQLALYHASAGLAILLRAALVFPLLDWLGVNYLINTLVGVLLSATVNYLLSDKYVFSDRAGTASPPEGLERGVGSAGSAPLAGDEAVRPVGTFSVVIPAYNEEEALPQTLADIHSALLAAEIRHEILVVNDNSTDGTEEVLRTLAARIPGVRYVNNHYPNGFGFAVRCGLEQFQGDAVAVVMADSSDSPRDLVAYFHKLNEGYDCVFGSRFVAGGLVVDYPRTKLLLNRCANLFIQVLFGLPLNDTTNAFKAYRRHVIQGVAPLISHHFNLTVEIPLKAIVRGFSFAQIPISWHNRTTGISKLRINEMGSRYLFVVLSVLLEKWLSKGDYVSKPVAPRPVRPASPAPQESTAVVCPPLPAREE